ncbi:MAG: trigger factor [Dictyoglomus sp.]|nr:trigger factor [Dictyoglomus sp.]MCX7845017.1 trigger factor [Dictyoglomaceae bacterium]MDW8187754.1 trigger factor [Dictyoglomus sp.]
MVIREEAINYTFKKEEGSILTVDLEIDSSQREIVLEETYKYLIHRVNIPGFRRGKAPRVILEKFLGEDFYVEAIKIAAREAYKLVLEKEKIKPYSSPIFNLPQSWNENEKIKISFSLEIVPEIKIGEYKGFDIKMNNIEVNEEEINKVMEQLRLKYSKLKPVEDREVIEGDLVYVERETKEGERLEPLWIRINGEYNPEIEKELVGMKVAEHKIIETKFPEDYPNSKFAGRVIPLIWRVKKIWAYDLISDETLSKMLGYETLDDLYKGIRERILLEKREREKDRVFGEILKLILERSEIDPPQSMVLSVVETSLKSIIGDLERQGKTFQEYLESIGKSEEEFIEDLKSSAKTRIKVDYLLNYIAEKENIKVSDEELEEYIEEMARSENKDVKELKRVLNREGLIEDLRKRILINKVKEFLIEENMKNEGGGSE